MDMTPEFIVLAATLVLYVVYSWLVGASKLRLG